jgi:hypothetical protein
MIQKNEHYSEKLAKNKKPQKFFVRNILTSIFFLITSFCFPNTSRAVSDIPQFQTTMVRKGRNVKSESKTITVNNQLPNNGKSDKENSSKKDTLDRRSFNKSDSNRKNVLKRSLKKVKQIEENSELSSQKQAVDSVAYAQRKKLFFERMNKNSHYSNQLETRYTLRQLKINKESKFENVSQNSIAKIFLQSNNIAPKNSFESGNIELLLILTALNTTFKFFPQTDEKNPERKIVSDVNRQKKTFSRLKSKSKSKASKTSIKKVIAFYGGGINQIYHFLINLIENFNCPLSISNIPDSSIFFVGSLLTNFLVDFENGYPDFIATDKQQENDPKKKKKLKKKIEEQKEDREEDHEVKKRRSKIIQWLIDHPIFTSLIFSLLLIVAWHRKKIISAIISYFAKKRNKSAFIKLVASTKGGDEGRAENKTNSDEQSPLNSDPNNRINNQEDKTVGEIPSGENSTNESLIVENQRLSDENRLLKFETQSCHEENILLQFENERYTQETEALSNQNEDLEKAMGILGENYDTCHKNQRDLINLHRIALEKIANLTRKVQKLEKNDPEKNDS